MKSGCIRRSTPDHSRRGPHTSAAKGAAEKGDREMVQLRVQACEGIAGTRYPVVPLVRRSRGRRLRGHHTLEDVRDDALGPIIPALTRVQTARVLTTAQWASRQRTPPGFHFEVT